MKRFVVSIILILISTSLYAQRGCCSWHGGVAGCDQSSGRQICADGTLSPSCVCYAYIENQAAALTQSTTVNIFYLTEQA